MTGRAPILCARGYLAIALLVIVVVRGSLPNWAFDGQSLSLVFIAAVAVLIPDLQDLLGRLRTVRALLITLEFEGHTGTSTDGKTARGTLVDLAPPGSRERLTLLRIEIRGELIRVAGGGHGLWADCSLILIQLVSLGLIPKALEDHWHELDEACQRCLSGGEVNERVARNTADTIRQNIALLQHLQSLVPNHTLAITEAAFSPH